jgi:hypothetical protein
MGRRAENRRAPSIEVFIHLVKQPTLRRPFGRFSDLRRTGLRLLSLSLGALRAQ